MTFMEDIYEIRDSQQLDWHLCIDIVLKKYKDKGVVYSAEETDERGNCAI